MGEIEYVWFYINIISKLNFYIHINKKYIVLFVYLKLFKRLTHIKIIIEYNINNQNKSINSNYNLKYSYNNYNSFYFNPSIKENYFYFFNKSRFMSRALPT